MPTLSHFAIWIQDVLGESLHDDIGAIEFVLGNRIPLSAGSNQRWQVAVDLLHRLLKCDLVRVSLLCVGQSRKNLLSTLQTHSPFTNAGGLEWNGPYFRGSARLRDLFMRFPDADVRNGPADAGFVDALEAIFAENGVPWSDAPLLPVHTTVS
jgi:hypothetical protein